MKYKKTLEAIAFQLLGVEEKSLTSIEKTILELVKESLHVKSLYEVYGKYKRRKK